MRRYSGAALACAVALSGCGGAGGGSPMPSGPSGSSSAAFVIRIPSSAAASGQAVRPQYVSPATQSLAIAVTGASTPVVANLTPASPNGTPASGSNCSPVPFPSRAPVGTDTFTVTMYASRTQAGTC